MKGPSFFRQSRAILFVSLAAMAALIVPQGTASAEDPPGNNGTVKLDGIVFDDHPNNEPHVGCIFQLDYYGFDEGDLFAKVRFVVIPPSGSNVVVKRGRTFIGEDPAGGGTDLDASQTFNLASVLQPYYYHPNQGYHIKVVVNAEGSIGNDTKYKVFWVEDCEVINS